MDSIEVEILPDGRLKITTGKVSSARHGQVDALLREILADFDGEITKERRKDSFLGGLHEHNETHHSH